MIPGKYSSLGPPSRTPLPVAWLHGVARHPSLGNDGFGREGSRKPRAEGVVRSPNPGNDIAD